MRQSVVKRKNRASIGEARFWKVKERGASALVATTEHRGEGLDLLLATTPFAGLLIIALGANTFDDVLAIKLLLHAAKRAIDGLVFTDFDLNRHVDGKGLSSKKR